MITEKILTKREVADILRIKSTTTLDTMIRRGEFIKGFRRGRRMMGWLERDVRQWVTERKQEAE